MGKRLRAVIGLLGTVLISAPLSIVTTMLLHPFWSWLEAVTGIESVGHSGPAEWCYVVVFLVYVAGGALVIWWRRAASAAETR